MGERSVWQAYQSAYCLEEVTVQKQQKYEVKTVFPTRLLVATVSYTA